MTDYQGNRFQTCLGEEIQIDETLTLRQAVDNLFQTLKDKETAQWHEHSVCGAEAYAEAMENTKRARRYCELAAANYKAAMFRETGYWPMQLDRIV